MNAPELSLSANASRTAGLAEPETVEFHPPVTRPVRRPRRQRWLWGVGAAVVFAAVVVGGWQWWLHARCWVETDNATVSGEIHQVSTRVAGTVSEVLVQENQTVTAGEVLARLDRQDFAVVCEQAQAAQAQADAQVVQAGAQVALAAATLQHAQLGFDRADRLLHQSAGAISQQEFDDAKATLDAAKASLNAARAAEVAARAQLRVAAANVHQSELQQSYTQITAPSAGRIGRKNIEVGNRVQPGQALLALVDPEIWVTANFKETQLAHMRPGQPVELAFDAFPARAFTGVVESLSPASGAKFALLPPDNATGNFTKIVQRVPVRVTLNLRPDDEFAGRIVPGMSALVRVRIRD